MSFWEKNVEILRKHYPDLFEELNSTGEEFPHEIKIETAPTGDPTLSINGLHVHSPRDPAREGQRLAQSIEAGDKAIVILGFGLGYAAQYAAQYAAKLERTKGSRSVIIVEKHKKLFRRALELRDLTELLSAKNIIFIVGGTGDGIVNALAIINERDKDDIDKAPAIIRNRALIELDSEWYKNVENKIRTFSMKDKVNTATLKRFGKRWVRNIVKNMSSIRDLPGIERILTQWHSGTAVNFPVFLAAAGPSLDKIKPMLRDIYDRCIIIAVDTNFSFFTNNGIQPDFVLTCDPQFWNSRHLDRCYYENTTLIVESAVYPSIVQLPFKRKFICGSLFPLSLFIEKQVDSKGRLGAGGSVATTAWDFAMQLAMSNEQGAMSNDQLAISSEKAAESREQIKSVDIWIAGLDLAFPGYKTHFRGARFEERANSESNRFNPVETWVARALRDGVPFKAKSCTGDMVLTDSRLSLYAAWFENQFNQHKNICNLALFQEGLAINGMQAASAEELLALPVRRKEIDAYFEKCYAQIDAEFNNAEEARKRSERYDNAIASLTSELNSIKKAAEEGIKIIQSGRKDAIKELDRITQRIADSEVKEIVSFLMPINDGNGEKEETDYFKSSLKLFTSLSESAGFYLGLFIESYSQR